MTDFRDRRNGRRGGRWRFVLWGSIGALLLLPLVAMQFTEEVNWTALDFAFAGALLVGGGAIYEFAAWKTRRPAYRALVGAGVLAVVALIWAQGAVGVF